MTVAKDNYEWSGELFEKVAKRLAEDVENDEGNAKPHKFTADDIRTVWHGISSEILDGVTNGKRVSLSHFGTFYSQRHKGHVVQFGRDSIPDYVVFKFSAAKSLNAELRKLDADGRMEVSG